MPQPITVEFDPQTEEFAFEPEKLRVSQGRHDIVFRLKTAGGGKEKASFNPDKGVYIKNGQSVFTNGAKGDFRWIEIDDNRAEEKTTYSYNVTIIYKGRAISSPDPFIVNDPPI